MKKRIRNILSLLLAAVMLAVSFIVPLSVTAADDKLNFVVASDIHIDGCRDTLPVYFPENELYFHANGSGNLYDEAPGLLKTFLKEAAEMKSDFVLIPGDMTRSGNEEQHTLVAKMLGDFEKETGIPVYVVPGNHDYFNSVPSEFKEYYADVCYKNALAVDDETASYTADLPKGYRLIAVDSNDPGVNGDGMTDRLYNWIDEQVAAANADGKKIIYTMHHTLLEHLPLAQVLMKDFIVKEHKDAAEKFCNWGIQYTFTGHEHGNDIAKYTGKNGNTVYDVLTTALSSYPLEYRTVSFSDSGVKFGIERIEECDFSSLIDGYNEKQLELMKSDYTEYSLGVFKYAVEKKITKYVSPEFIKEKLKVEDGVLANEADAIMGLVEGALEMPLYDTGDGSTSIESLAAKKGITIPKSDYASLIDLVTSVVAIHYHGNENLPSSETPECEILVKGLNTGLEYILANAGPDALKALLGITDDMLGFNIAEYTALSRWFASAGSEDSYRVAGAVLYPILDKFTVDTEPDDREVTLPAIGQREDAPNTFAVVLSTITDIFKYVLNIVLAIIK